MSRVKKSSTTNKTGYTAVVPAVEQASRILIRLAQDRAGRMNLTDICEQVGIHKSKGYSILNTLQHFGFIRKDPFGKTYSLGPGLLFLSGKVLASLDLRDSAAPFLEKLAERTNSTALLGLIVSQHVYVVAKDEGDQNIGVTIRLGHRFPLTWGAHGKAIVAFLPEAERESVLAGDQLYFHGDPSRFDPARLQQEMASCRQTGYAIDPGEMKTGVRAVASPLSGPGGKLVGAVVVVGTFTKQSAERYGPEAARSAGRISCAIGGFPEHAIPGNE